MAKARLPGQISGEVIDMDFMAEYKHWLESGALSAEEYAELQSVADDKEEIESRFYAPLSFGTAGLRGVLGVGLNRMNRFTVGQAAQGLAKLIVSNGQEAMAALRSHTTPVTSRPSSQSSPRASSPRTASRR